MKLITPLRNVRGLGDVVDIAATVTVVPKIAAKVYEKVTGRPCGCEERRRALNEAVPFGSPPGVIDPLLETDPPLPNQSGHQVDERQVP
jgi:hypothetical protein